MLSVVIFALAIVLIIQEIIYYPEITLFQTVWDHDDVFKDRRLSSSQAGIASSWPLPETHLHLVPCNVLWYKDYFFFVSSARRGYSLILEDTKKWKPCLLTVAITTMLFTDQTKVKRLAAWRSESPPENESVDANFDLKLNWIHH